MGNKLYEIKKFMKENSNEKAKESLKKFVPTSGRVYGVYISDINKIVSKYKSGGFKLVKELWKDGYLEERILAAKILGKISKKDPELTLKLIKTFLRGVDNWAVCDTLATQSIRPIKKIKQREIFEISKKLVKSKNPWKVRFGIVLLGNFKKDKELKGEIEEIIKDITDSKNYYIRKAVGWIKR